MTLMEFVKEWNANHRRFIFAINDSSMVNRPTSVEIRYSAAKYQNFYSTDNWHRLIDLVDAKSRGTMYIVTDEYLFERGIIEAKLASCNHNYQERLIVGTLRWIGEEFFQSDINKNQND